MPHSLWSEFNLKGSCFIHSSVIFYYSYRFTSACLWTPLPSLSITELYAVHFLAITSPTLSKTRSSHLIWSTQVFYSYFPLRTHRVLVLMLKHLVDVSLGIHYYAGARNRWDPLSLELMLLRVLRLQSLESILPVLAPRYTFLLTSIIRVTQLAQRLFYQLYRLDTHLKQIGPSYIRSTFCSKENSPPV
jgi:hypothetical protein